MRLSPFRALRPPAALAAAVASPPYDVVTRAEAVKLAEGNPRSFLHVGRSDIDLPEDVDPHDPRVYAKARESLERFVADGTLVRDAEPALYVYREEMDSRAQVGVVGCVHVDDYERDVIRKHETTRPDKEDDRTRHILTLGAHAEPVLLTYRDRPAIDTLVARATAASPVYDLTAPDGVRHTVWRVTALEPFVEAFGALPVAYVADGHHRSASAWRAARERARSAAHGEPGAGAEWFPAVLFPASQVRILPYNRVVTDLAGQSVATLLDRLRAVGTLSAVDSPAPPRSGSFCFYVDGRWYLLELPETSIERRDPIRSLDVSLLQDRVLGPVLRIGDQRTDPRIDFVGGRRGARELQDRVDSGRMALAVSMWPTTVEQLMAVADAGQVMPPKVTWFEPKLASGLFVHEIT
jgi:uncharacterized protein (DUF1015 family)